MIEVDEAYEIVRKGLILLQNSEMFARGKPESKKLVTQAFDLIDADKQVLPNHE